MNVIIAIAFAIRVSDCKC